MKYAIKCDRSEIWLEARKFICGERYVYKDKYCGRYYVMTSMYSYNDDIELFVTEDLEKAKRILALVHEVWTNDFYIIGVNDDGTEIKTI